MATSPTMNTNNQYIKYSITVTPNSQNVANNTSNVTVSVRVWRTNTGHTTYGTGTVYCKINGVQYSASVTSGQKITDSGIVLFSQTLDIVHNEDGTKDLETSAWISHSQFSSSEQGYSQALTTIPRASQPSCITYPDTTKNVGDIGTGFYIHMNQASDAFTHRVYCTWGARTVEIATGVQYYCVWTIPMDFCDGVSNGTVGSGVIYVDTFNGATYIGTKSVSFTANVPASVVPTISVVRIAEATAGLAEQFDAYVQNKSTLAVSITAAGVRGSTITRYSTTIQGVSYTAASFTSQVLTAAGTSTISVTVTDSRGRTATYSANLTVLQYFAPRINNLGAYRIDQAGAPDDEGTRVAVNMDFEIADVGARNDRTYTLSYKQSGADKFQELFSSPASWIYTGTQAFTDAPELSTDYAYVLRLTVTDYFGSVSQDVEVPTAFVVLDFRNTGKGLAIGKVSEIDALEVAMDLHLTGALEIRGDDLADFVIEAGAADGWRWRKWSRGRADADLTMHTSLDITTADGAVWRLSTPGGNDMTVPLPFEFDAAPGVIAQVSGETLALWAGQCYSSSTGVAVSVFAAQPGSTLATVAIHVDGLWKTKGEKL